LQSCCWNFDALSVCVFEKSKCFNNDIQASHTFRQVSSFASTRDRFYESPFRPKFLRKNIVKAEFSSQILPSMLAAVPQVTRYFSNQQISRFAKI
jgi:hypothetical protein